MFSLQVFTYICTHRYRFDTVFSFQLFLSQMSILMYKMITYVLYLINNNNFLLCIRVIFQFLSENYWLIFICLSKTFLAMGPVVGPSLIIYGFPCVLISQAENGVLFTVAQRTMTSANMGNCCWVNIKLFNFLLH